nr:DUF5615 family PIN-like protein [Azospirillum oleiclasticum]
MVDAQLPPALGRAIAKHGHNAAHVSDLGLQSADDSVIWSDAIRLGAVIVGKDEDFVTRRISRPPAPPVVWVRIGNVSRRHLLRGFLPLLPQIVAFVDAGESIVEVRDG